MRRIRQWLTAVSQCIANALQPRIAQEIKAERPDLDDAYQRVNESRLRELEERQRVHYLFIMTELARLRRDQLEQ